MKERRRVPFRLHEGSCLDSLKQYPENHFDSCVTDPPYDLTSGKRGGSGTASVDLATPYGRARIGTGNGAGGFMGKKWDGTGIAFDPATWEAVLRTMKPGAHLLAFGGTRTWHRMCCAIEDAGFEIRDSIMWVYGSGFPKSLDASKAIDESLGFEREVTREAAEESRAGDVIGFDQRASTDRERRDTPATPQGADWDGWGTALKPAWEPIVVARKPLHGTVASNLLTFGTGAINIEACRINADEGRPLRVLDAKDTNNNVYEGRMDGGSLAGGSRAVGETTIGRWPANVIHDGSPEVMAAFPDAPGQLAPVTGKEPSAMTRDIFGAGLNRLPSKPREVRPSTTATSFRPQPGQKHFTPRRSAGGAGRQAAWKGTGMLAAGTVNEGIRDFGDEGSAARFFYCAKASQEDRHEGLGATASTRNIHPTVKPTDLMRYLCKLVTRPDGLVLDPFCGSGSTGKAAMFERMRFVGMDLEAQHIEISHARIAWALKQLVKRDPFGLGD